MGFVDRALPDSVRCLLTGKVMHDPVITADGNSFERAAIQAWLVDDSTSPLTGEPLAHLHLLPNRALRRTIAELNAQLLAEGQFYGMMHDMLHGTLHSMLRGMLRGILNGV